MAPRSEVAQEPDDRVLQITTPGTRDKAHEDSIQLGVTTSEMRRAKPVHSVALLQVERADQDADVITEWDSALYMTKFWPFICLLGASFGAVHLIAWNSIFPTLAELWLWRTSALVSTVTAILVMQFRKVSLQWEGPLTIVSVGSPILYIISRTIMSAQAFAALRAMPASTYLTFDVWNYWFHFL